MDIRPEILGKSAGLAFIDYFVHAKLHKNLDLFFRARFLVLMLMSGIFVISLIIIAALTSPLILYINVVLPITSGGVVFLTGLLYALKKFGSHATCGVAVILLTWAGVVLTTLLTGGPSLILHLLSLPCVMAFYLGGKKWGVATAILAFTTAMCLALLKSMGFQFVEMRSTGEFPFSQAFLLPLNIGMMTTLALVYEVTYTSLKLQRDREHKRYLRLAATDPLTGLANRRMFDETLAARIELYSKLNPVRPFALCYLDLDRFKPINDQFGHNIGDEVLSSISNRLHQMLRGSDFIGRHGGDEFLILLDSVQNSVAAEAMSKRFLQRIEEPIDTSAGIMSVSSSFGFALFPDHGTDAATLQRAADEAMYAAKRGRYGFKIYGQPP